MWYIDDLVAKYSTSYIYRGTRANTKKTDHTYVSILWLCCDCACVYIVSETFSNNVSTENTGCAGEVWAVLWTRIRTLDIRI